MQSTAASVYWCRASRFNNSGVLDGDRFNDLSRRFAFIKRRLQQRVEILPLDEFGRGLVIGFEELLQCGSGNEVAFILEPMYLQENWLDVVEVFQLVQGLGQLDARFREASTETLGGILDRTDLV